MVMMMLRERSFYFARHGETEHNEQGICAGGKIDSVLTEKGVAQAYSLKDKLLTIKIDYVISSPMIRARRTAEIAGGCSPLIDEDLREIDLGVFEGKPIIGLSEYIISLSDDTPIPGGESKKVYTHKILSAFNRWLNTHEGTFLFVAHGFVYATLLSIIKKSFNQSDLKLRNAALVHFYHNGIEWEINYI